MSDKALTLPRFIDFGWPPDQGRCAENGRDTREFILMETRQSDIYAIYVTPEENKLHLYTFQTILNIFFIFVHYGPPAGVAYMR